VKGFRRGGQGREESRKGWEGGGGVIREEGKM
jgi:hypothetical protein